VKYQSYLTNPTTVVTRIISYEYFKCYCMAILLQLLESLNSYLKINPYQKFTAYVKYYVSYYIMLLLL
jgi:hypothetical protein